MEANPLRTNSKPYDCAYRDIGKKSTTVVLIMGRPTITYLSIIMKTSKKDSIKTIKSINDDRWTGFSAAAWHYFKNLFSGNSTHNRI